VLPGIYFFAASAIMTMLAYGWANSVTPGLAGPKPISLQSRLAELAPPATQEPQRRAG
jgi:paraquat-inducible protein A